MPYRLGKGGKCGDTGWGVYKRDTGELVACHTTRRLAAAQFRLLEMITHEETKAATLKAWTVKYSEDQPRDDHGRFGSGGNLAELSGAVDKALRDAYFASHTNTGSVIQINKGKVDRSKNLSLILDRAMHAENAASMNAQNPPVAAAWNALSEYAYAKYDEISKGKSFKYSEDQPRDGSGQL
jgi:hypothetical protein